MNWSCRDMWKIYKRPLELLLVGVSFLVLSDIYLEDLRLGFASGTPGIFYGEFILGAAPLIFYLFFWKRKRQSSEEDTYVSFLRFSFGYLWVFDAFLQMQPGMNEYFAVAVISPNVSAGGIAGYLAASAFKLWNLHPMVFDVAASLFQLYIGVILLTRNSGKIFLLTQIFAIFWGIIIWSFGEGFGGVFSSGSTILTGFPGSALIYVYASSILFLATKHGIRRLRTSSQIVGALIFIPALLAQLIPSNGYFWNMPRIYMPMPSLLGTLNFANNFQYYFTHSLVFPDVITVSLISISAVGWLLGKSFGYISSSVLAAFSWVIFEGMGFLGILSTDPNTGLPLLLISVFFYLQMKNLEHDRQALLNVP